MNDLDSIEAAMRRGEWRALPDLIAEVRELRGERARIRAEVAALVKWRFPEFKDGTQLVVLARVLAVIDEGAA